METGWLGSSQPVGAACAQVSTTQVAPGELLSEGLGPRWQQPHWVSKSLGPSGVWNYASPPPAHQGPPSWWLPVTSDLLGPPSGTSLGIPCSSPTSVSLGPRSGLCQSTSSQPGGVMCPGVGGPSWAPGWVGKAEIRVTTCSDQRGPEPGTPGWVF